VSNYLPPPQSCQHLVLGEFCVMFSLQAKVCQVGPLAKFAWTPGPLGSHKVGVLLPAAGCSADLPKTGGASIREMASEIGSNLGDKLGVHMNSDSAINSKADEAMSRAADKAADTASSVVEKAREAVSGSKDRSG